MNHIEEVIPANANANINECNTCRSPESTDRVKSLEHSSQIAALMNEEKKLKSLHRRLEMRIKQFLHRTQNSILTEEKLLNIEKCSQKELLLRRSSIIHKKSSKKESKILWNNIKQIEDDNQNLQKTISSLCHKIKQFEQNNQYKTEQNNNNNKTTLTQTKNQLHRMNSELNKICTNNTELRLDIKRMLDKRREMIEEYNQLHLTMQNATNESRQLTYECSENFANRRNLVERMRSMRDQDEIDEKKLLDDIRGFDRLLERNNASKNFILKKSNLRQGQIQLNELFAGKHSEGRKSGYTADEFHRLFRRYFNQDFVKEKVLNRTVEIFLNEQEQSFALFEYAVELINELDHLHEDLQTKRKSISDIFSTDNIDSFLIKDLFATLESSVNKANINVQSLEIAKINLRELLDNAYQLISNLFLELNCDRNIRLGFYQTINDRNILLYLATIESRVQQLLPKKKRNQKSKGYTDETTISWKIDYQNNEQTHNSLLTNIVDKKRNIVESLRGIDSITPQISLIEEIQVINGERFENEKILSEEIVNSVLNAYNECVHIPDTNLKNNGSGIEQIDEVKL